ncbi:MAG TPA: hypothetical protein VFG22_09655 [Polyangiales bacterium]|jgi:alpha-glucosidase|nr:hypothetical protein [Polyangiales bacterium]
MHEMFAFARIPSFAALCVLLATACTEQGNSCPQAPGLIAQGVVRFSPSDVDCEEIPSSMALLEPMASRGPVPADWPTQAVLSTEGETHRAKIAIASGTSLYGTGEIAGPILRNGFVTQTWGVQPYRHRLHGRVSHFHVRR